MNTPQSMAVGWAALLVAGLGSLYFAKQEINARRRLQHEAGIRPMEKKNWYERLDDPKELAAHPAQTRVGGGSRNSSSSTQTGDTGDGVK